MACHAAKIATTNDYASFRKARNGEQKVIANKAQNTFYSSNKNAIIYMLSSQASLPLNLVALRGKAQTHFLQIRYISTWHFAFCSKIIPDDNGTCTPFKDFILPTS